MTAESLFAAALEKPPAERAPFLEEACGGDAALFERMRALLAADEKAAGILERPVEAVTDSYEAEPPPTGDLAIGTIVAGRFKLLECLGEGGMGTVYVAEQFEPVRRKVALKLIKPGMDSKSVLARFETERQALALMDHPNIAKVLDGGMTEQKRPYFVMEYIKGVPFTDYCDSAKLTVRERLDLFAPVCQAVQHAHQKGIIHRDLKPSNILVALYDGKPVPKVIDFGLAKAMHQPLTERSLYTGHQMVLGTPLYMSPEQSELNNLDVDTRTDIYSLGVILYELLTGATPLDREQFQKAAWEEVQRLIREEEPSKPSTKLSGSAQLANVAANRHTEPTKLAKLIRGDLDWIVMKALEKDRSLRYEAANGLSIDVQRYLADEPIEAGPPSARYKLRKFVRRNRTLVFGTMAVVLALVAGITGTTLGMVHARAAEAKARDEASQKELARAETERQRQQAVAEKDHAVRAEQDAKAQAALAESVNRFLQVDLLGQADVGNQPFRRGAATRNRNISVGELLDRAAAEIEGKFTDQPQTEGAIRFSIGRTYFALGRYAEARTHLEHAVQLYSDQLGPDHPITLGGKNDLACVYFCQGDNVRAEQVLRTLVDTLTAQKEAGQEQAMHMKNCLAVVLKDEGKYAEAERLYLDVVAQGEKQLGPTHVFTLNAKLNLSGLYQEEGKLIAAERILKPVCDELASQLGPDHPLTMASKHSLLSLYHRWARDAEAEPIGKEVLQLREKNLGYDHPETLVTRGSVAAVYWGLGRLDESIPLFEEVLRGRNAKFGDKHAYTLFGAVDVASNYRDAGRLADAVQVIEEWLPRGRAALGPTNPAVKSAMGTAASIYERDGDPAKAEPLRRELVAMAKQSAGTDSSLYASELAVLGTNLLLQKKPDAEALLRESLAISERKDPNNWSTFNTKSILGTALVNRQNYAEAEPLLLQAYAGLKERQNRIYVPVRQRVIPKAVERIVQLYEASGKPDEAAKWRKELEAVKTAAPASIKP